MFLKLWNLFPQYQKPRELVPLHLKRAWHCGWNGKHYWSLVCEFRCGLWNSVHHWASSCKCTWNSSTWKQTTGVPVIKTVSAPVIETPGERVIETPGEPEYESPRSFQSLVDKYTIGVHKYYVKRAQIKRGHNTRVITPKGIMIVVNSIKAHGFVKHWNIETVLKKGTRFKITCPYERNYSERNVCLWCRGA